MEYVFTLASLYLTHLNGAAGNGFKAWSSSRHLVFLASWAIHFSCS